MSSSEFSIIIYMAGTISEQNVPSVDKNSISTKDPGIYAISVSFETQFKFCLELFHFRPIYFQNSASYLELFKKIILVYFQMTTGGGLIKKSFLYGFKIQLQLLVLCQMYTNIVNIVSLLTGRGPLYLFIIISPLDFAKPVDSWKEKNGQ